MRIIKNILLAISLFFGATSCSDNFLTLSPTDMIVEDNFFLSLSDADRTNGRIWSTSNRTRLYERKRCRRCGVVHNRRYVRDGWKRRPDRDTFLGFTCHERDFVEHIHDCLPRHQPCKYGHFKGGQYGG